MSETIQVYVIIRTDGCDDDGYSHEAVGVFLSEEAAQREVARLERQSEGYASWAISATYLYREGSGKPAE